MIDTGGKALIGASQPQRILLRALNRTTGETDSATLTARPRGAMRRMPKAVHRNKEASPTLEATPFVPALSDDKLHAPTYDPKTSLFYVTARDQCAHFQHRPATLRSRPRLLRQRVFSLRRGKAVPGIPEGDRSNDGAGEVGNSSTRPRPVGRTLRRRCWFSAGDPQEISSPSMQSQASRCGIQMGGAVYAAPMAFAVDGKEYVAIAAGSAVYAFGLP